MGEPIQLWNVETGEPIILFSPSEARRLVAGGVLSETKPAQPEPVKVYPVKPERMPAAPPKKAK